mgnify:CR=1 FL=1
MPNRYHSEHLGMFCIVMPSIFVNCPAVICLPNIASYLRETPLVICGPRSYLLHTVYNTCCNHLFTVPCNSYCFPHCAINSLFCKTGEIDNLSVSSWAKFWFVSVQIPRYWRRHRQLGTSYLLAPGEESSPTTFRRSPSPTGSITLGRNSRENLLLSTS